MKKLLLYARRALEVPPAEAVARAREVAAVGWCRQRERLAVAAGRDPMDAATFARSVGLRDAAELDRIAGTLFRSGDAVMPVSAPALPSSFPGDPAQAQARTDSLNAAAAAIEHRFDLLGSGPVRVDYELAAAGRDGAVYRMAPGPQEAERQLSRMEELLPGSASGYRPIDWHVDFISGYRWDPGAWFSAIEFGHRPGVDIKVPWELSRLQHAGPLGLAWRLDPDGAVGRRAPGEFRAQVVDWIAANPVGRGANWSCAMDVAIRATSWLMGLELMRDAPELDDAFRLLVARNLHAHARHIEMNLEYHAHHSNNHYLADITGLLCIAAALPEAGESDRWLLYALQQLDTEMHRQVLDDGVAAEGSQTYHCLVAEMFALGACVALRLPAARLERLRRVTPGRVARPLAPPVLPADRVRLDLQRQPVLSASYLQRLALMADAAAAVTQPDGRTPQVGDNDSGRMYVLVPDAGDPLDRRSLLAVAGRLFGRRDFTAAAARYDADAALIAADVRIDVAHVVPTPFQRDGVVRFADGGFIVARTGPLFLLMTMGRVPEISTGGHYHNDLLSFDLAWDGASFIADGGTYVYTPDPQLRNAFRETAAHSTIAVEGAEQRGWPRNPRFLFNVDRDADITVDDVGASTCTATIGYPGVRHTRSWIWSESAVTIEDRLDTELPATWRLNLAPGVSAEILGESTTSVNLVLRADRRTCHATIDGVSEPRLEPGTYSRGYGRREANERFVGKVDGRTVSATLRFSR